MLVLTNPTPAILAKVRSFKKKYDAIVPIKLADGRYGLPDQVLTFPAFAEYADLIQQYTTHVPDDSVELADKPTMPLVSAPERQWPPRVPNPNDT